MNTPFYMIIVIILLVICIATLVIVSLLISSSGTSNKEIITRPSLNKSAQLYSDTHAATALVLGCIDYRLINNLVENIDNK
jgi:flagellar basal body-associated protein FliL